MRSTMLLSVFLVIVLPIGLSVPAGTYYVKTMHLIHFLQMLVYFVIIVFELKALHNISFASFSMICFALSPERRLGS